MNGMALGGILLEVYAAFCIYIAIAKPPKMWDMSKIKMFRKYLGESGTVIFFIIWGLASAGIGVYLMIK